jgi:hypothetical protein
MQALRVVANAEDAKARAEREAKEEKEYRDLEVEKILTQVKVMSQPGVAGRINYKGTLSPFLPAFGLPRPRTIAESRGMLGDAVLQGQAHGGRVGSQSAMSLRDRDRYRLKTHEMTKLPELRKEDFSKAKSTIHAEKIRMRRQNYNK